MNRSELVKVLELVKPALASAALVPIFQCFNFKEGRVSAYDDTIAIVGPCEFEGSAGIHGNTLLGLLSNSRAETIELDLNNEIAVLKMGKSVSKLPYSEASEFIFEEPEDKWDFKIPFTQSLFEAVQLCLETVSTDATQAALLGITIQGDKLYSCDGDGITRIKLKGTIGKNRVLMPTTFCLAVIKLWSSLEMTKGVLHFSHDWIMADFGDWCVYGRVLEITDPIDFEALIKKGSKGVTTLAPLPEGFAEALSRARVLSDPESAKTVISIGKGKFSMLTETHMGEIRDTLTMKAHPDIEANVNASHLQKAIQHCDQIAFLPDCTLLEKAPDVLLLVSNMA